MCKNCGVAVALQPNGFCCTDGVNLFHAGGENFAVCSILQRACHSVVKFAISSKSWSFHLAAQSGSRSYGRTGSWPNWWLAGWLDIRISGYQTAILQRETHTVKSVSAAYPPSGWDTAGRRQNSQSTRQQNVSSLTQNKQESKKTKKTSERRRNKETKKQRNKETKNKGNEMRWNLGFKQVSWCTAVEPMTIHYSFTTSILLLLRFNYCKACSCFFIIIYNNI